MKSERLYYGDAYTTDFDAVVRTVTVLKERPALVLNRTHFYPTSGGQPYDTGQIESLRIIDVVDVDGTIHHITDSPLTQELVGRAVSGAIDWPRRYDHMQQHSAQHLLSQTFFHLFGFETSAVHFGTDESTIDLDTPPLADEKLAQVERFANQQVYANLPIKCYFMDENDLDRIPLRRAPKVRGQIRIVEIEAFDYSACGGTHCRRTGELGPIKLIRQIRQKRRSRITFLAGWRALADYTEKHRLLSDAARLFDNDVRQVPLLIASSQQQAKEAEARTVQLTEALIVYESAHLVALGQMIGGSRVIDRVFENREVDQIRRLAIHIVEEPNHVVLFGLVNDDRLTVIFARSQNVAGDMGTLLRQTLAEFGGGGGGRPDFAQGGGAPADSAAAIIDWARHHLSI